MTPPAANPAAPTAVPPDATARLVGNLEALVSSVHEGLADPAVEPAQKTRWTRAAGLLTRDLGAVRAAARLAATGNQRPLVAHASDLRYLARRMDGYRLDFAGPALAERLETQRRLTVLVAWQIFSKASGSRASGL